MASVPAIVRRIAALKDNLAEVQKIGQSRMDLAASNVQLCRTLVPKLLAVAPEAILLMVTNPVDVITYAALKISGLPNGRVFGSGTVLDRDRKSNV